MRVNIGLYVFLTSLFLAVFICAEKNESVFVPSREWKTVEKGTPIPAGLHIRHNFQTGITEAKLMDDDETKDKDFNEYANHSHLKSLILHPDKTLLKSKDNEPEKPKKESEPLKFPLKELKARLKKMKAAETDLPPEINDKGAKAKMMQKFRNYETLKDELKDLKVNVTTDAEVLKTLFKKFKVHKNGISTSSLSVAEIENVLDILNNLEYLIHQIDNAHLFTDMEGIANIISPCLNSTYQEIQVEALRLLGAAVQSNPKVQEKALENDLTQKLLHMLSTSSKAIVKSRCLFALSALVRQFPAAQKALFDRGGLEIFGKILSSDQLQAQIKVMKLINDLIIERQDVEKIADIGQRDAKTREYAITNLEKKLLMHRYCKYLNDLMIKSFEYEMSNQHDTQNYELLEIITESMITISPICKIEFQTDKNVLLRVINNMLNFCQIQSKNGNSEDSDIINNQILLLQELKTIVLGISLHEEL